MNAPNKLWKLFETVFRYVIGFVLGMFGRQLTEEQWTSLMQFVKFCIVGLSNTAISFGIYYIFIFINKDLYIVGNAVGFVVSVLNAYFWNSRFVFNKRDKAGLTILKTFAAYGTNLILGTVLLYLMVDVLGISAYIAPFINLAITVPLNYILNKKWAMK